MKEALPMRFVAHEVAIFLFPRQNFTEEGGGHVPGPVVLEESNYLILMFLTFDFDGYDNIVFEDTQLYGFGLSIQLLSTSRRY
jgi:hypothetical protein